MPQTTTSHRTAVMPTIVASARSLVPSDATRSASTLARHAGLFGAGSAVDFDACETLFIEGDSADWLYEVVGGSVCTYKLMLDGRRQITAFHFPGDLLGLRVHGQHVYGAEAITRARLRRYAHAEIDRFVARSPDIARHLLGLAEDELTGAQEQMLLLGRKTARERLVSFLLLMAERARRRGAPANPVSLPMTRSHIADYLGLTVETVSRAMTQLRSVGLVVLVEAHKVELRDVAALRAIAAGEEAPCPRRVA
jgi:CRP/FNR family transcriptional regulator